MPPTAAAPLICFDVGGIILRHCRSWAEASARAGIPLREGFDAPELVTRRRALTTRFQIGAIEADVFFEELASATGERYSAAECRVIHEAWLIDEYAGVAELIDDLHAAGLATAALSNTNEAHWRRIRGGPGDPRPDFPTTRLLARRGGEMLPSRLLASHEMGLAKPDPAIYARASALLGVPGECIVFFDDLEDNVRAARACGWRAHRIDHTGDTASQMRGALAEEGVV